MAVDEGLVVDRDDHPVVVEFLDDLSILAALAALPPEPLALLARGADFDALAFFGCQRLDVLGAGAACAAASLSGGGP